MLYSLPHDILSRVYEYDPTFRDMYTALVRDAFHYTIDYYSDGSWRRCKQKDGLLHGRFQKYARGDRLILDCHYKDNAPHGPFRKYHFFTGKLYIECSYTDGVMDGFSQNFYEDGRLHYECWYVNGKKHGPYRSLHKNGRTRVECFFIHDKKHGPHRSFDRDGIKTTDCMYHHGKLSKRRRLLDTLVDRDNQ